MSLKIEGIVDDGMYAEESLGGSSRFEPPHLALSSSHHLVRIFCPIALLEGKVAIVTGANSGISQAIVLEVAWQGAGLASTTLLTRRGPRRSTGLLTRVEVRHDEG